MKKVVVLHITLLFTLTHIFGARGADMLVQTAQWAFYEIHHYGHHRSSLTILEFIAFHDVATNDHHDEHDDHDELPFHPQSETSNSAQIFLFAYSILTFTPHYQEFGSIKRANHQDLSDFILLANIWKPPKQAIYLM